jgi:hypothetical protein
MYTLNLAELPATKSVEFLVWVVTNQIGNYRSLIKLMTKDIDWYYKTSIPFECTEQEATLVILRWS